MTITDADINRAVTAAHSRAYRRMMDRMEEEDARQEEREDARATMPLTEMNAALGEEYLYQDAFNLLMADGSEWHTLLLTDRSAAEVQFSEVMESCCKAFDIKHNRQ